MSGKEDERKMFFWKYKIVSDAGVITTQNQDYAEEKSKMGKIVFCKRESNIYRFNRS